jgi:hypothetical protein
MAKRRLLTTPDIDRLRTLWPELPPDYLTYLREVGWGTAPNGRHMIYSGPIFPDEVYPHLSADTHRVLIGDDMQGYCLAYDFSSKRYGEYSDSGEWSSLDEAFDLSAYLIDEGST